jgi:DNA-binding MarR family transcriptional regulator
MADRVSHVQRAIKQTQPFPSRAQEGLVGMLVVADRIQRTAAPLLEPHGITPQQYNVLRILRGAGDRGLPTLEIAERMIQQAPGITRLLDRLEAKRLVARERCREDRRRVWCRITPAGLTLLGALDQPVDQWDREALGMLSRKQVDLLVQLVNAILADGG